jgi:membrane-associated HD superfamily phosphohydrolase
MIITAHVKDGLELAKEYGLPSVLHPFIAEHHGTTVVKYFHHAASEKQAEKASGRHDRMVADTEFRYPGPRPLSRETAVLMLADAAEGAVRALAEPSPGQISGAVHAVIMDRLNDGQLTDCNITMKELTLVEEALVKSLSAMHHRRIAYPKKEEARRSVEGESAEPTEPITAGHSAGGQSS